ncbi:hypothetical protein ACFC1D_01345 [Streptomyces vinaceus]|uniref:hypothetical protein n=1 Tax=Streptomyces vinaceus TaxID=1960 RepID=UPI0035D55593
MTVYDPEALARQIAQQIAALNEYLIVASPQQAARILGQVLEPEEGVLGSLTTLMATGSRCEGPALKGALPPEVWLALARAANELHDIALDLDEHAEDLHQLAQSPPTSVLPPAPSPLVVRRHR